MSVPTLDDLLTELDLAPHGDRVRRLALLGRDHADDAELGRLLDGLEAMGGHWQVLAVVAAVAARQPDRLVRATHSSTLRVRSAAWSNLLRAGAAVDDVVAAAAGASTWELGMAIGLVRASGRVDVAEGLLPWLRAHRTDAEAGRLLPACSASTVAVALPELAHAIGSWSTMAVAHPALVLDHLEATLEAAPRSARTRAWARYAGAVPALLEADADRVLRLVEASGPVDDPTRVFGDRLGWIVRRFPARVVALLLHPDRRSALVGRGVPKGVLRSVGSLATEDRIALGSALRENPRQLARFLDAFPPSDRSVLFDAAMADVDTASTIWPRELLEALPHATRRREALRMLALPAIADDPASTLRVRSFLPITEARPSLEAALGTSKPEDRAVAYAHLVACARRGRRAEEVAATLSTLRRLRNEQDPVRLAAVAQLAGVHPDLFDDDGLTGLEALTTAVIDARDTSRPTIEALRRLVLALVAAWAEQPTRLARALSLLDRLAGPAGTITFGGLERTLRHGAERALLDALLPRLRTEADRDDFGLTLALAAGLGRRAWELDELQDLLRRATRATLDTTVRRAVDLWLAAPTTRADRLGALVAGDPSLFALASVLDGASYIRQDLLDVLLRAAAGTDGSPAIKGRFLSGNVRFVPVISSGLDRWLPRQHAAYAVALHALIRDSGSKPWVVASALKTLGRLPLIGTTELLRYRDDADVSRQEAVLATLAWTDDPGAQLGYLLSHADGDRARVAIYAASRCAAFARPDDVQRTLIGVLASPTAKVTSRKEAIRLLARHAPEGAAASLLAIFDAGAHRDVRIAIARSLRGFLHDPAAWTVLEALAVASADEARALLDTDPDTLAPGARAHFGLLIAAVAGHPDPIARGDALAALPAWAASSRGATTRLLVQHIADLGSGGTWRIALRSLLSEVDDGSDVDAVVDLTRRLLGDDPTDDAGATRDRPSRQRLGALVDGVTGRPLDVRMAIRSQLSTLHDLLSPSPTTVAWQVQVTLAAAELDGPAVFDRLAEVVARRPAVSSLVAGALASALRRDDTEWTATGLLPVATAFATRGTAAHGLVAVAIAAVAGPRSGWAVAWRDLLRTLRADADVDVSTAALSVLTAPE